MRLLVLCILALLIIPSVLAATRSYQKISTYPTQPRIAGNVYNMTVKVPKHFTGLQGIVGVNVQEQERLWGPPKPFGKPAPKRLAALAPVRSGYIGLGGTAAPGPNVSITPCAAFNCKPSQYVVGDLSTKEFYRCHCAAAKSITMENVKCIDTPALAQRIGFHAGKC